MSDPDYPQEQPPQDLEQEHDEDDNEWSDHDYYDPQDDLAYYHEQRLLIEESWLEWERQNSVNNRQSEGPHDLPIFQKPGSMKRRERKLRSAQALWSARANSRSTSAASSASGSMPGLGSEAPEVDPASPEKQRRLGTYRLISGWEATLAAREERLAAKARLHNSGENIICTLPVEILSHILSHLDPDELTCVSLVCRLFHHVVNADSCWKEAFIKYFGVSIPFQRLYPRSWRAEYIKRTSLLRRWEKGRGSNILIDPKTGQISNLWAEADNRQNEGWFLVGGRSEGVLARCHPSPGRTQRDVVCRMDHLVNTEVSVMAVDRHRVLWGLTNGQVALTTLGYTTSGLTFETFPGFHQGPVSCVKLVRDHLKFVLTGGVDGVVRLWNAFTGRCVRKFKTAPSAAPGNAPIINHICCEPESHIIAGASNGEIYVWKVNVNAIFTRRRASEDESSAPPILSGNDDSMLNMIPPTKDTPDRLPRVIKLPEEFNGVGYLEVDFGMNKFGLILAQATDANVVHIYGLETLAHLATLKSPVHDTPISAVYWDIPKYEKSIISTSNGSCSSTTHSLHKRQEKSSVIATGDHAGNVCLWYLSDTMRRRMAEGNDRDLHPSQAVREARILAPSFALKAHDAKVTSLFVDALVIVSGSADGSAMAWNSVNGELVTVLNTGHYRGRDMNGQNDSAVNCLVVNSLQYRGVLSVGGLVRSWDFSPEAALAKDKHRKPTTKKPIHYSGGPKNRIEDDIRNSVQETVSIQRLEALAKERREHLHRRYNNLEGLNMADMTDEEIVEYVMMLSKQDDRDDQEAAQIAREIQLIQKMEDEIALEQGTRPTWDLGGEGSSSSFAQSAQSSTAGSSQQEEQVTEQELEEEEELVRRAIAMSMLDMDPPLEGVHQEDLVHGHSLVQDEDIQGSHSHSHQPVDWETGQVVDVDVLERDDREKQEDEQIVHLILQELEGDDDDEVRGQDDVNGKDDAGKVWPTINEVSASTSVAAATAAPSLAVTSPSKDTPSSGSQKMTWSMVARTQHDSPSVAAGSQPTIIKQYPQGASQEEIEDEDTQLARILSLSMVEK